MADRYYIGARYVPAVYEGPDGTNTWLPGVAYDGLVIVTYGTYSYMSKKPVPAGMDPPDVNTEYWIRAAVYNVVELLDQKADKDGVYPDLFAGNLISDRNGEYEPYKSTSYSLGSDTLRGLFKLDANNRLYADGDRKEADGTITRKYGIRAYQSGDESLTDAITDGTNTVYKLATPTTEQSTQFTSPQVCYPDGTEKFVTENGVPVGHETEYPYDLKGIIETLAEVPAAAGTYTLKAIRSGANITYTWEQEV